MKTEIPSTTGEVAGKIRQPQGGQSGAAEGRRPPGYQVGHGEDHRDAPWTRWCG